MKTVLFIHRSVGENLIIDGHIYRLLEKYPNIKFSDYNVNNNNLRTAIKTQKLLLVWPNDNTRPKDYSLLFSQKTEFTETLDFIMNYDIIIIKSCYPNSNIKNDNELNNIKSYYLSIVEYFKNQQSKKLIIFSSPPLRPTRTNKANSLRARNLSNWMTKENFADNISVFNLFDLLADQKTNLLKKQYQRLFPFNMHPNKKAGNSIAPDFINLVNEIAD